MYALQIKIILLLKQYVIYIRKKIRINRYNFKIIKKGRKKAQKEKRSISDIYQLKAAVSAG